ncbi:uncharacterized protein LOC114520876 [Dendronephthya gigantea]|uniref:uncharacterized protein LOC114520876 n=1 Tax=Dendronephthya gigantea TaxID=151771 RepID=UPI0010699F26|nr:uncharacterized protein LOC114520876 [Dendronephthya gigantea]
MDVFRVSVVIVLFVIHKTTHADLQHFDSKPSRCNESSINYNIVFKEGHHAGTFQKETDITDMVSCIDKCCQTQDCDVAFMSQENCYLVDCYNIDSCGTKHLKRPKFETMLSFVAHSRRNRLKFAEENGGRIFVEAAKNNSPQMDHPLILNSSKQHDRLADYQQKYSESMSTSRSEIIDIILAIGASIVAISAAIIGVITMTRKLTDRSERSQYETIK